MSATTHAIERQLCASAASGRALTISSAMRPDMQPRKTVSTAQLPILHGARESRFDRSTMKRIVRETVRVMPLLAMINKALGAMEKKDDTRRPAATMARAMFSRMPASTFLMNRTVKRTIRAAGSTMSHISSVCQDCRPAYEIESIAAKQSINIDTSSTTMLCGGRMRGLSLPSRPFLFKDRPSDMPASSIVNV